MTVQKYPILDPHTMILAESGALGMFICTSGNSFDYTNFDGVVGWVVKLTSKDGVAPEIASLTVNGVLGDTSALIDSWMVNEYFFLEIEQMSMISGQAIILLKPVGIQIETPAPAAGSAIIGTAVIGTMIIGQT